MTVGAAFCQVCGQGVDQRHPRPHTGALNVRTMFAGGNDIPMRPPSRQHTEAAPSSALAGAAMAAAAAPSFSPPPSGFGQPSGPGPHAYPGPQAYPSAEPGSNAADAVARGRRRPTAPRPQPSYPGFGPAETRAVTPAAAAVAPPAPSHAYADAPSQASTSYEQGPRRPQLTTDQGFGQAAVGYGGPHQPSWAPAQPPVATPVSRGPLRLVLVGRDGQEGESFLLPPQGAEIGRSGTIAFPSDPFVSPQHARLTPVEGGIHLVDLGSRNGVYLRVTEPVAVYPGDFFLLGNQLLRLDRLANPWQERPLDGHEVRGFGTPAKPPWAMLTRVCVGEIDDDRYHLRGTEITIGREQGEIVFPNDGFLSRAHARIRMEVHASQMAVVLDDLDSANGTYLRIRGAVSVPYGGMFRVGDQIFRLRNN